MDSRPRGTLALAGAACAFVALPAAAEAGVNELRGGVLAPKMAKLTFPTRHTVVRGGEVRVRVRLRGGVRSFRAWLDSRDVTWAFGRIDGGRAATLRPALGVNHVHVRTRAAGGRRDFETVRFVRARRAPRLLRVRTARRVRTGRVRLTLRLDRGFDRLRGSLNGRSLARVLGSRGRRRSLVLDGSDGLHFGRNRLSFTAVDEAGRFDVERRTVVVARARPIPAAGAPRRARLRRVIRLDARRSLASHKERELSFRWSLVDRPKGSRARLRGTAGPRPRLRPDRTGRYRVRLEVLERPPAAVASAAVASRRSVAVATIAAAPYIPPGGVPIQTVTPNGVKLGAPINQTIAAPDPTQQLQLVVLDRSDLSVQLNKSYAGNATGAGQLAADVHTFGVNDLAIIATPESPQSRAISGDQGTLDNLHSAFSGIGASDVPAEVLVQAGCSLTLCANFSAIGVPGGSGGTVNPGLELIFGDRWVPRMRGNLSGYLRKDSSGLFTYVSGDYVTFNTVAPATTAQQAAIQVGSTVYKSDSLPAGQGGFFVLILDAGRLEVDSTSTFAVTGVDPQTAANNVDNMLTQLEEPVQDETVLVFIQSIGAVERLDTSQYGGADVWNEFSQIQSQLGGHAYYLQGLQPPNTSYAFVGPGAAPGSLSKYAMTAGPGSTNTPGQLAGVLGRNPQSQFYPKIAGPTASLDVDLPLVVNALPQPWPERDTAGHNNAIACIASSLTPALKTLPIEENYTDDSADWDSYQSQLDDFTYAELSSRCEESFTEQDFDDVSRQLKLEWADLGTVAKLVANLQQPMLGGMGSVQAHVNDVYQAIQNAVAPPNGTTGASPVQIMIDIGWIASYVPGVGDAIGAASAGAQLALDISTDANGNPAGETFQAQAEDMPDQVAERLENAYTEIDRVGHILMTDWGKLQTAADKAVGDWAWDSTVDTPHASDIFDASMTQQAWQSLFPLEYVLYRFGSSPPWTDAQTWQCVSIGWPGQHKSFPFNPFGSQPNGGVTINTGAGPQTDLWAWGRADDSFLSAAPEDRTFDGDLPLSLWQEMFQNQVPNSSVQGPPLLLLRFALEAYTRQRVVTTGEGFCEVDGQIP